MTTYYLSPYGSDANNGLGPDAHDSTNKPWLTFGKLLGASGFASGDTCYVCPGTYREAVTVAMTSATVTTSVLGDPQNVQGFKDNNGVLVAGGDVVWTSNTVSDWVNSLAAQLTLAGRDFLFFANIYFPSAHIDATTQTSTDVTFQDCAFIANSGSFYNGIFDIAAAANVALNWTWNRCFFVGGRLAWARLVIDTPATADFNLNVLVQNCRIIATSQFMNVLPGATTNTFKFGGVAFYNCSHLGSSYLLQVQANHSTSVQSTVYNCYIEVPPTSTAPLVGSSTGQIVEDYNIINAATPRTNVAIGTHSVASVYPPVFEIGQSSISGRQQRPFFSPSYNSPALGFGAHSGGPSVDFLNRPRPSGVYLAVSGTATSGAAKTLTDTAQAFPVNGYTGWTIQITGGTGSGQTKSITSNTATVVTVDGNWQTNPDNTSTYQIYWGDLSSTGKATAGAATTVTDSNAAWGTNQWTGYIVAITGGTGSGQSAVVVSNTGTVLTCPAASFSPSPNSTSTYSLYKATGVTTQDYAAGAFERHDQGQRDSVTYDVSPTSLRIDGVGDVEISIPVDATSTTISIRNRFDTAHGTGSPPDVVLLANGECGVTTQTVAAAANANTWQTITLSAINPTAKGIVTLRLRSHAAAVQGQCWFDTLAVA